MPENTRKGIPKYPDFGVLYARNQIEGNYAELHDLGILKVPDESDIVGNILMHRRYTRQADNTETV